MTDVDQAVAPEAKDTTDLQWFRDELEQQRRFRLDQLTQLTYDALAAPDSGSQEVTATLTRAARVALAEIDAALFRITIGRFGDCQRCGRAISAEVLHAMPMASLCLRCQLTNEAKPAVHPWRTGTIPSTAAGAERDIVEVWGEDSFPASDPPANW
jgi:RNA polymerase-binding transcription factor DksA